MAKTKTFVIQEEQNKFHDNILEIWGREFKFDHEKGISELIKNSADAYIRKGTPDNKQYVVLRFTDEEGGRATIENIDFVGMTSLDIQEAFQWWGDPEAAKRGMKKKTYGGHGNGGKFYMRQMFDESYFVTFRDGKMSVFGFSENKKYGFANYQKNKPFKDIPFKIDDAIRFADIEKIIPSELKESILKGEAGFTVVRGVGPSGMKTKIKASRICEKIKNHPQARRVLIRIPLSVIQNEVTLYERLLPDEIKPRTGFEELVVIPIPSKLSLEKDAEKLIIEMENLKYPAGKLILRTSEVALERGGRFSDLNRVDIIGELGVIGSYRIYEMGIRFYTQAVFLYGECECPILEEPENSSVSNDREKLIPNDRSNALLQWIRLKVDELAERIAEQEDKEQEEINKKLSSTYNDFLNEWKNKFMRRLFAEVLVGPGEGPGGGFGSGGSGGGQGTGGGDSNGTKGGGPGDQPGGGDKPKKTGKFPMVKLSSFDDDPLNEGKKVQLDPRQPVVYQRIQDVDAGIYWINTSSPLAAAIIEKYGAEHLRWRDFLFQRYIDIFIKEALQRLAKKDPDRFNADTIDAEILGTMISKVHEAAAKDLGNFLFDDSYNPDESS